VVTGDRWHRGYWKNPRPEFCERCGRRAGDAYGTFLATEPVRIVWDHCHKHLIVRGALCNSCNADEGAVFSILKANSTTWRCGLPGMFLDRRRKHRFTDWYKRCPQCAACMAKTCGHIR
jgi:hypothetical protein